MAKLKELFLIGTDKLQCYEVTDDPNGTESPSDIIAFSVSNATTNEFYYDEDFAIPFDANLTDGKAAPLEDSLLLYSTQDGVSTSQCSEDETILSPYRTVVDLSDSEVEMDQRVNSSGSEGGSENYWGTDSRLLRGCGISVENDQLSVDMERSGEDLSSSSDSLALERDCDRPEVRLTTWAEVGNGSLKRLNKEPEGEIETSSSSEELDQCESNRLVTWAGLDNKIRHDPVVLESGLKRACESVDTFETGFMQYSGSQLSLATGFASGNVSLVAKDTKILNGSQSQVPLEVGMTTWRTLMTSGRHGESSSSSDGVPSAEEWPNYREPEYPTSPRREESVTSPSSKDDGYDSVTKDLSIHDSQSIQDSDEVQPQCHYYQFEGGFSSGGDSAESTLLFPEILRQALKESRLCSSISTTDDHRRGMPYHLLDNSLIAQTVEDQQESVETMHPLFQGCGAPDEKSTTERWDSLNSLISSSASSSSCQQSVVPVSPRFAETSKSSWDFDTNAKLSSTHERKGQQLQEVHTLPKLSKRMGSWNNVTDSEASTSFGFYSLMRPLPDLGFLRKSPQSDRDVKQNLRICSETKTESMEALKKQFILNSESTRPQQTTVERDSVACSLGKEPLLEAGNRGNSSRFISTLSRMRSRSSDSAFSAHSSTSSGIDPGIVDLDDGYGTWNHRKSTLKGQNQLVEPWNLVARQIPETTRISRNCAECDLRGGDSRRTERLVVKVCNACNTRTVHLEEEKQASQRSLPLFADCETRNLLTLPPKIIVSSADNSNNKNYAFDTIDPDENKRFGNTALDTGSFSNNYNVGDISLVEPISYDKNTDTMNIAFDTVNSGERYRCDSRKPGQREDVVQTNFWSNVADHSGRRLISEDKVQTNSWSNVADHSGRRLVSEDGVQANSWSNVADHSGIETLFNDDKSHVVIDSKERRKVLTNSSTREQELVEQCANTISPKTVYIEFGQQKDNGVKRMERQGKREKEIQIPRANKNVSILENGVRFRPGSTKSETASQCTASKAIRVPSVDQGTLRNDVIGVWKPATSSHHEAGSPVDDQPPVDFMISSDTDSSNECNSSMDALTKKTDLLLNTMRSAEMLLRHFNRNRALKGQSGSTQSDDQVGHLVLDHLCPAVLAILMDGLKPEIQGLFGTVRNSVRQVIEDSATLGHPPNLVGDLVTSLKRLKFLNTPWLFFNAFVFALLNCKALDFWLSYVHSHTSLLQKHYAPVSFLRLSHSTANRAFQDLIAFLQPLALVPFRLEYNFEVKILEGRMGEYEARRALEQHLASTDTRLGLFEIQQGFSNDKLLECSQKLAEERSCLGNAELAQETSDELQRYSSLEESNDVGLNRRPLYALETLREDNNEVGSNKRPLATPRSSTEVVGAGVIPRGELRPEPHAVAINHGAKYTPGYRNYQRNSEPMSPLCPGKQINYKKEDNQVSRRAASSVLLTQHSSPLSAATQTLWSDCRQQIGLVKNRLERLVFGNS